MSTNPLLAIMSTTHTNYELNNMAETQTFHHLHFNTVHNFDQSANVLPPLALVQGKILFLIGDAPEKTGKQVSVLLTNLI